MTFRICIFSFFPHKSQKQSDHQITHLTINYIFSLWICGSSDWNEFKKLSNIWQTLSIKWSSTKITCLLVTDPIKTIVTFLLVTDPIKIIVTFLLVTDPIKTIVTFLLVTDPHPTTGYLDNRCYRELRSYLRHTEWQLGISLTFFFHFIYFWNYR